MLQRCQVVPEHRFKLDEKVYLLDATIINLLPGGISLGHIPAEEGCH